MIPQHDTTLAEARRHLGRWSRNWLNAESQNRQTIRALQTSLVELDRVRREMVDGPYAWVHNLNPEQQGAFRRALGQQFNDETGGWWWPDCACHGCCGQTGCVWPGSICGECGAEGPCAHFTAT